MKETFFISTQACGAHRSEMAGGIFCLCLSLLLLCSTASVSGHSDQHDSLLPAFSRFLDGYRPRSRKTHVDRELPSIANGNLQEPPLKIGAFNIRIFGVAKMENDAVKRQLVQILSRYDVVLVQEIRDKSGQAILELLAALNKDNNGDFAMEISERLGHSSNKEQYAYLYRQSRLMVVSTYQYPDPADTFERPPFCIRFHADNLEMIEEFGLIGVHTSPDSAVVEIDALTAVYEHLKDHWQLEDSFVLGDFNADCSYVTNSEWPAISLWTDTRFEWLIDNNEDTTTTESTDCAYDRIVAAGEKAQRAVVTDSATVFLFDQMLNLSESETLDVSDHYPVEIDLSGKVNPDVKNSMSLYKSFTIEVNHVSNPIRSLTSLRRISSRLGYRVTWSEDHVIITRSRLNLADVVDSLAAFSQSFNKLLSRAVVDDAELNIQAGMLNEPAAILPGMAAPGENQCSIEIRASYHAPYTTSVIVKRPIFLHN